MRRLSIGIGLIALGWIGGWLSHNAFHQDAPPSVSRPDPVSEAQVVESQDSVNPHADQEPADNLARLLEQNDYQAVIEYYESLQLQGDDTAVQHAREAIVSRADTLAAQHRYRQAARWLQYYLVVELRDAEARLRLAEILHRQQQYRSSVDQIFEAMGYAYRPAMLDQLTRYLRIVVADQVNAFEKESDYSGLLEFYQYLTQAEPSHAPHFIGLASAQLALNDRENARRSLQLVIHDPNVGHKAQTLLSELSTDDTNSTQEFEAQDEEPVGVPLIRQGSHFLVDVRINNSRPARLLIDTGASLTILTPDALERIGLRDRKAGKHYTFNTANGRVTAPIYGIDRLAVDQWQVSNLEVGILEMTGSPSIDGLLGMNFLRHFQFFIDQNQAMLRLSLN